MAYITLNLNKLKDNYEYLDQLFKQNHIEWGIVVKMLCGNKKYLEKVLSLGIKQVCDSRISNLKIIKSIAPDIETVFIKPAAKRNAARVVEYADISFNTELETIKLLSKAAVNQNKTHRIMIMIELGELREGVMRDNFIEFYSNVFELLYKQLLEAKFNKQIPYISGGASVTIPLILNGLIPSGINHFRVGETLYLGTDVYYSKPYDHMHNDVFKLFAEIIELNEKPSIPSGELGHNLTGEVASFDQTLMGTSSYRAIVDVGLLDVEDGHIYPVDKCMQIVGASSDMIVVDLGENPRKLKVGDSIEFSLDYMGILRIMNSDYVEKKFEE